MTAPRGKGIYARAPAYYPNGDPAQYALEMGCSFVAFLEFATEDHLVERAHSLGLDTYWWAGPDSWLPNNWERTLDNQFARAYMLGMRGLIADLERAPAWQQHERELLEVADALKAVSEALPSVGLTSFPSWPWADNIAATAPRLWGSPQLYGVLEPAPPPRLRARGERWRRDFRGGFLPSLAAWSRTPEEQAIYLSEFSSERGAIFWQGSFRGGLLHPAPGTALFEVLRRWQPGAPSNFLYAALRAFGRPVPWPRRGMIG